MKRKIITTADGSTSIYIEDWQETYHSKHGAVQEAIHVFIKNGLTIIPSSNIAVLEIGFGTGLNALISCLEADKTLKKIHYYGVDAYPVSVEEIAQMNYPTTLNTTDAEDQFNLMHQCNWNEETEITPNFYLTKCKLRFEEIDYQNKFDIIYFDAFGYRVQPELWSLDIFKKMYLSLKKNGVLVTYAARSIIKKNMIEAGFTVEKMAGPPGKREMMRATK